MELTRELEGDVAGLLTVLLCGTRNPFVDGCVRWIVTPPAVEALLVVASHHSVFGRMSLRPAPSAVCSTSLSGHVEVNVVVAELVTIGLVSCEVRNDKIRIVCRYGNASERED